MYVGNTNAVNHSAIAFLNILKYLNYLKYDILIIFMFIFIFLVGFLVKWSLNLSGEIYLTNVAKEIIQNDGTSEIPAIGSVDSVHDKFGYQFIQWYSNHVVKNMKVDDRNLIVLGY